MMPFTQFVFASQSCLGFCSQHITLSRQSRHKGKMTTYRCDSLISWKSLIRVWNRWFIFQSFLVFAQFEGSFVFFGSTFAVAHILDRLLPLLSSWILVGFGHRMVRVTYPVLMKTSVCDVQDAIWPVFRPWNFFLFNQARNESAQCTTMDKVENWR